jgi:hypothetical protein
LFHAKAKNHFWEDLSMNPFWQSLVALLANVLILGLNWRDAVAEWLKQQIAVLGSREAVEERLRSVASGVGCDCTPEIDAQGAKCCAENPQKFGDGTFINFLKTVDWAKFAQFIMTIIAVIPKGDTAPGPVAEQQPERA